jgi:hypothetical protein
MKTWYEELVIVPKKCRLPWCSSCGVSYWGKVRAKLRPHLHLFKRARLFTLTVDPKNFPSGEQAYYVIEHKEQYIKRILRLLGFKKAFKVMAFHKSKASRPDGHEWPHWHVVVDMADVGRIDLRRIWGLWRDKWKVGGLDLQVNRRCRNASAAINYAVSYCQHQSGVVADWVRDSERAPRAYEVYGQLREAIRNHEKGQSPETVEPAEPIETSDADSAEQQAFETSVRRDITYVGDRLNHCDSGSLVLLKTVYGDSVSYEYVATLDYSEGQILLAGKLFNVDVRREIIKSDAGEKLRLYIPLSSRDDPETIIEHLQVELNRVPFETIPI